MTIVPRTVGAVSEALITSGSAAAQGIAMLNPQRWGQGGGGGGGIGKNSYSTDLEKDGRMLFEAHEDDDEDEEKRNNIVSQKRPSGTLLYLSVFYGHLMI